MCRPVLRILFLISLLPSILTTEAEKPIQKRLVETDIKYEGQEISQDLFSSNFLHTNNLYHNFDRSTSAVGQQRFPQTFDPPPGFPPSSRAINTIPNVNLFPQLPLNIINPDIILGRILPPAGGIFRGNPPPQTAGGLPPNLIRAEIPQSVPPVVGTIGSGSIGYTNLGNGLFAVGSGALGFAAHVPSQTGKGSITAQRERNQNIRFYRNLDENSPHAYPKPIDINRELSEQKLI